MNDLTLLWDITQRCNLSCIHCYNALKRGENISPSVRSDYEAIIDRSEEMGVNHIHLLGGEPFVIQNLLDIIDYASRRGITVTVNTNGTMLSQPIIDSIVSSQLSQITISIDGGTAEDNDYIRGDGTFDVVIKGLCALMHTIKERNSSIQVQIATVVTQINAKRLHFLPRILKELGIHYLAVMRLYETGNALINQKELQIDEGEWLSAVVRLLIEAYRHRIILNIDCKPYVMAWIRKRYGFTVEAQSSFASCQAGKKILYLDERNYIFPCGPMASSLCCGTVNSIFDENPVGTILVSSLPVIPPSYSVCTHCDYRDQCSWCPACSKHSADLCQYIFEHYSRGSDI